MKRSSKLVAGVISLSLLLVAALRAEEPARKAEALKPPWQRLLQGDDTKQAAEQERKLAQLRLAGQFAEALKVAEALVELREKVQRADHWEAVNARSEVEAIRQVLNAKQAEQQSCRLAFAMQRQADVLRDKGRYREAQPLYEQIRSIYHKVLGEEHPYTAASYNNVAYNLNAQGKYREAEEGYRKALAIRRKVLGEEHPYTATSYNNVASNLDSQGKYKEAEEGHRKALAIRRKVLGEEHPDTASSYNNVAYNLSAQGKYQQAEEDLRKALAIYRKVLGEEHPNTSSSYNNLAVNLTAQGKYQVFD